MANKKSGVKKKSSFVKFIGIVLALFTVFVSVFIAKQLNEYIGLKAEKEELEVRIEEETHKNQEYANRMEYYNTDEYIEKIARDQLGLVMPDELVFKVDKE